MVREKEGKRHVEPFSASQCIKLPKMESFKSSFMTKKPYPNSTDSEDSTSKELQQYVEMLAIGKFGIGEISENIKLVHPYSIEKNCSHFTGNHSNQPCVVIQLYGNGIDYIPSHSYLLEKESAHFSNWFTLYPPKGPVSAHKINFLPEHVLRYIIYFIEKREVVIYQDHVYPTLIWADLLQFYHLKAAIRRKLIDLVNCSSCISIYCLAVWFDMEEVKTYTLKYIAKNVSEAFLENEKVLNLPSSQLITLFQRPMIREDLVWRVIHRWINVDRGTRIQKADKLLDELRLSFLSDFTFKEITTFLEEVAGQLSFENDVNAMLCFKTGALVDDEVMYSLMERNKFSYRIPSSAVICHGGMLNGECSSIIELYDTEMNEWHKILPQIEIPAAYHGLVLNKDDLFFIGGYDGEVVSNGIYSIKLESNTQRVHCYGYVDCGFMNSAVIPFDDNILFIGGQGSMFCSTSCLMFNPMQNVMHKLCSLPGPRSDLEAAQVGEHVYVVGGRFHSQIYNTIHQLIPGRQHVPQVATMHFPVAGMGVCASDGALYILGGVSPSGYSDALQTFDPREGFVRLLPDMTYMRAYFGVCALNNNIYAIGGYNGINYLNNVEMYDIRAGKWMVRKCLKQPRTGNKCVLLEDSGIINELITAPRVSSDVIALL
ncbi:Kelch-like protein 5 [Trichinella papuae]|uniref:Kelch-like protein 5 n=1 Tax=Trichinella papuae TaxID=268474 RepID=A0A0V1MCH6_9BILA|nr:Kelch-like protein 5 [Trichinella papuae]